jgi:hypothetical protein
MHPDHFLTAGVKKIVSPSSVHTLHPLYETEAISLKKELMWLGVEADFPPGHVHFVSNDSALIVNCSAGEIKPP